MDTVPVKRAKDLLCKEDFLKQSRNAKGDCFSHDKYCRILRKEVKKSKSLIEWKRVLRTAGLIDLVEVQVALDADA
ncbi:hypothetical protein CEXT_747191 [Caerostris extrusa]|uniref:Uncharacterized protein n=1 Tax=Caerostris extrusa TaxID=172846 RepID=A0AAV4UNJ4_CAEEX|nr:hypothetical protein CEXT_747191 [Caerostris extrusa]